MTDAYVFDTYALIEIIKGNQNFKRFEQATVIINPFIFAEICYYLLKIDSAKALEAARIYRKHISLTSPKQIFDAMVMRLKHKKNNLSTADCVSYIQAQSRGVPFLTGDGGLEGMPGVEFVK